MHNASKARRCTPLLVGALVAVAGLSSCSDHAPLHVLAAPSVTLPPTNPDTSAPVTVNVRLQVLQDYRRFWQTLPAASRTTPDRRRTLLAMVATAPELLSLQEQMHDLARRRIVFYGRDIPRPRIVQLRLAQGVAVIRDCQNSSHAGNRLRHGRRLTVGIARHLVIATLRRSGVMSWRVSYVGYRSGPC